MQGNPTTTHWSPFGVLLAPVLRAVFRDPAGTLLVPILLQAPILALSSLESVYLAYMADAQSAGGLLDLLLRRGFDSRVGLLLLAVTLVGVFFSAVAQALVVLRVSRVRAAGTSSLETDFRHALRRAPAYILVWIVFGFLVSAGLLVLVLPGLLAIFFWGFAPILTVSEDLGVFAAMAQSQRRVRGRVGRWLVAAAVVALSYCLLVLALFGLEELLALEGAPAVSLATHFTSTLLLGAVGLLTLAAWTSLCDSFAREGPGFTAASSRGGRTLESPAHSDSPTRSAVAALFE